MRKPKMILFDYGHTLAYEPDTNFLRKPSIRTGVISNLGWSAEALSKARLEAEDVWFCGDQIVADVHGAQGVGMFPVRYEDAVIPDFFAHKNAEMSIEGEHLHIHHWGELVQAPDDCEE